MGQGRGRDQKVKLQSEFSKPRPHFPRGHLASEKGEVGEGERGGKKEEEGRRAGGTIDSSFVPQSPKNHTHTHTLITVLLIKYLRIKSE